MVAGMVKVFAQGYRPSLEVRVPWAPEAVSISGQTTLWYELYLTNFGSDSLMLEGLEVIRLDEIKPLLLLDGTTITNRLLRADDPKTMSNILPQGATGVLYLEFSIPRSNQKYTFAHNINCRRIGSGEMVTIKGGVTKMSERPTLVIGKPVARGTWVAVNDPAWPRGHRRVIYIVESKARVPGRFAIDFIQLDDSGHYARGDENIIQNWYGYGNEVLAVADGIIAMVRDDFPESPTIDSHPTYLADKATGNYISIDLGNGRFAFYEHLKPGSVRVKTGQQVKRGQVIAAVGFTGQSNGPHLHFHVADANSPLAAEGVPFVFDEFELVGTYATMEDFGRAPWKPLKVSKTNFERPSPNAVIRFH